MNRISASNSKGMHFKLSHKHESPRILQHCKNGKLRRLTFRSAVVVCGGANKGRETQPSFKNNL